MLNDICIIKIYMQVWSTHRKLENKHEKKNTNKHLNLCFIDEINSNENKDVDVKCAKRARQ